MADYSDIRGNIGGVDQLARISDAEAAKLREGSYPEDYIAFLSQIGFGNLGDLQLYSWPVSPGSVYPSVKAGLEAVVLFGDDFQGYCFGFDAGDGMRVVEVDPRGVVSPEVEASFDEFIRSYLG